MAFLGFDLYDMIIFDFYSLLFIDSLQLSLLPKFKQTSLEYNFTAFKNDVFFNLNKYTFTHNIITTMVIIMITKNTAAQSVLNIGPCIRIRSGLMLNWSGSVRL